MIDYVDPIPPLIALFKAGEFKVYGNTFPTNMSSTETALLVRVMGGTDYHRIQLLTRSTSDISAMYELIEASNFLIQNVSRIQGLRATWAERESNPIHSTDQDTGRPEAWCYMRVESLEA